MLRAIDISPFFQGLLTIAQTFCIHLLSCSTIGLFQYFTNEFHAWMGQPSSLATFPPTFQSCFHFCLVELKCSCIYFSTMLSFNGGSITRRNEGYATIQFATTCDYVSFATIFAITYQLHQIWGGFATRLQLMCNYWLLHPPMWMLLQLHSSMNQPPWPISCMCD